MELANVELEHQQAAILAPMDGIVTIGDVKVGDILERGKPVVEIAAQKGFHFEAAVPSEEVGHRGSGCRRGSSWMRTITRGTARWQARWSLSHQTRVWRRGNERPASL